jgi:hypothetical protein
MFEDVPARVKRLAEALAKIHGPTRIAKEKHGYQIYMASPICLERDGRKELRSRHLAVNAERYFLIGMYSKSKGIIDADKSAMCMKTGKIYRVSELLRMRPIKERGLSMEPDGAYVTLPRRKDNVLIKDANGNLIPDHPGQVVGIEHLDKNHQVWEFLHSRGFYDAQRLVDHMGASYCEQEAPEQRGGHYYRRLVNGFKDTPQGRLILYAYVGGVQVGWQARLLELIVDDTHHLVWHPYRSIWEVYRVKENGNWVVQPDFLPKNDKEDDLKSASKYRTADGALRNNMLMGFDASVKWNKENREPGRRFVFLAEGPLDAARLGVPAVAFMGKYLAPEQAKLLTSNFDTIIFVPDNDSVGRKAVSDVTKMLIRARHVMVCPPDDKFKDAGEMPQEVADEFVKKIIARL